MSADSEFAMLQHALAIAEHSTRASSVEVILAAEVRRLEEKEAAVVDSLGKSVMEIKQLKAQLEEARKALLWANRWIVTPDGVCGDWYKTAIDKAKGGGDRLEQVKS